MEDRIALVIIAVLIVAAPFIAYVWQGNKGGMGWKLMMKNLIIANQCQRKKSDVRNCYIKYKY